jgi:hypothetical protein
MSTNPRSLAALLMALLPPLLLMEALRAAGGGSFSAAGFGLRLVFVLLTITAALVLSHAARRSTLGPAAAGLALLLLWPAFPWFNQGSWLSTPAAMVWLALAFALPLSHPAQWAVFSPIHRRLSSHPRSPRLFALLVNLLAASISLLLVVFALGQSTRFSEEEFFLALQVGSLALIGLVMLPGIWAALRGRPVPTGAQSPASRVPGVGLLAAAGLLLVGLSWAAMQAYQDSFYTPQAAGFPGISQDTPFLCQELDSDLAPAYSGPEVFSRLLERVEANNHANAPEFGMLALGRMDLAWAERYRSSLLDEALAGKYTGPAHSVKFGQYEASLRLYYYPLVRDAFPGLFSEVDQQTLEEWFAAINRRTMTAEWVDWMYGLTFRFWPEGPYENQENGAGLLALLEAYGLADPDLSAQNRAYLDREPRGWQVRFRNTDDALIYQPEWIYNALFQSLYEASPPPVVQVQRSFDWLAVQARPSGARVGYNHVAPVSLAGITYLGAVLLEDPELLWQAGRALDALEAQGLGAGAVPGAERAVPITARSPQVGSCLIYGDSGLPTQVGPLAADKIVMRQGWQPEDAYLLLNLRFTGWHRYKATGALIALDAGEPLALEQIRGERAAWLPIGRSLFRDKRLPRENLNAFLIPNSGLAAVFQSLTSTGSLWAQDPPFYARVNAFSATTEFSAAEVTTPGWRGWQHTRWITLHQSGPILIEDRAAGPAQAVPALAWHVAADVPGDASLDLAPQSVHRLSLRGAAEVLLIPLEDGHLRLLDEGEGILGVQYQPQQGGELGLLTVFLTGEWVGASANLDANGTILLLDNGDRTLPIPLQAEPATSAKD